MNLPLLLSLLTLPFWNFFKNLSGHILGRTASFDTTLYCLTAILFILALVLAIALLIGLGAIIYDSIDKRLSTEVEKTGKLVGRHCEGSTFTLYVKSDKVYDMDVTVDEYFQANINDTISFKVMIGGLSKKELYATTDKKF